MDDYFDDFFLPGADDWSFDDGWLDEPIDETYDDDDDDDDFLMEPEEEVYYEVDESELSSCHEDWEDEC